MIGKLPHIGKYFLLLLWPLVHAAFADCTPWVPPKPGETLPVIGSIIIDNNNVFDTSDEAESTWLHRTGNSIRIKTRKMVIERQLLFKSGDIYDPLLLAESERLLRSNSYIKTAQILPGRICDGKLEIEVITTDSWTLTPSLSFGRSGGVNNTSIEIEEHNVLGYGKELNLSSRNGSERDQNILLYVDNNLFGSRNVLSAEYQDNSDGRVYGLSTGLPFFQFASDHAWGINARSTIQDISIYEDGLVIGGFGRDDTSFNTYYAWADAATRTSVDRYWIGWSYDEETSFESENHPATILPEDTIYSSPFIGWQHRKQLYIKTMNLYGVAVTEDISIGYNADIQLGWINQDWGSTSNYLSLAASYSRGYQPNKTELMLWGLNINGLQNSSTSKDAIVSAHGSWFLFHDERSRLQLRGLVEYGSNLSVDNQLSIGGDSGLRGYPLKYQNGDRKFLFSLEERYFFEWYPLHLMKTGVSAFADVGAAWDSKSENRHSLADVGFGFLFASTRQSANNILRVDFAFPLDDNDLVDGFQILIGAQTDF